MVSKVSMIVNLEVVHFRIYNLISFVVCEYNNSSSYRNEVQNTCKKKTMAQFFSIDDTRPNLTKEQEEFLAIFDEFSDEEKARVAAFMQGMRKV